MSLPLFLCQEGQLLELSDDIDYKNVYLVDHNLVQPYKLLQLLYFHHSNIFLVLFKEDLEIHLSLACVIVLLHID